MNYYTIDYEYIVPEKRAMEHAEILNKIHGEAVIKRPIYVRESLIKATKLYQF